MLAYPYKGIFFSNKKIWAISEKTQGSLNSILLSEISQCVKVTNCMVPIISHSRIGRSREKVISDVNPGTEKEY